MRKTLIMSTGAILLLLSSGCTTAFNQRQFAVRNDAEICSRYGVDRRSQIYLDCIELQERRRDAATLRQNQLIANGTDAIAGRRY